jgi:DNA-binding beta-propeller fold protein YncE
MRAPAACCDCGKRLPVRESAAVPRYVWTAICAVVAGLGMFGAAPVADQSPSPALASPAASAIPTSTATPLLRRVVTTYAGTGAESQKDGSLLSATFADVRFIAADPDRGSFFVTDKNEIREITKDGRVVTVAGSAAGGTDDGAGSAARFYEPNGIAYDPVDKALYICDFKNFEIRRMTIDGVVTTLAGSPLESRRDGTGSDAGFSHPQGIAYDARDGALYVADSTNNEIRRVTTAGVVSTVAGGREGFADGTGPNARFNDPAGIAYDALDGDLYVTDPGNERIRRVTPDGVTTTVAGGSTASFFGPKALSRWGVPVGIAWDPLDDSLYVADLGFNSVRRISPTGVVSNFAGNGSPGKFDGVFEGAEFESPVDIAADPMTGYLYVTDFGNNLIRQIQ